MTPLFSPELAIEDRRLVELDEGDIGALLGAIERLDQVGYLLIPEVLRGIVRAYENSGPAGGVTLTCAGGPTEVPPPVVAGPEPFLPAGCSCGGQGVCTVCTLADLEGGAA